MQGFARVIFIGSVVFLASIEPAFAYLDPGTGSMLLQGILAAFAATAGVVWTFWAKLKQFFQRMGPEDKHSRRSKR